MRKLLERRRDRREAIRKVFRQTSQVQRDLSGLPGEDHEVEVVRGRWQGRRGKNRLPISLFGLAGSRGTDTGQAVAGNGSAYTGLPGFRNSSRSGKKTDTFFNNSETVFKIDNYSKSTSYVNLRSHHTGVESDVMLIFT